MAEEVQLTELWEKVVAQLEREVRPPTFQALIKSIEPVRFENNCLEISVGSEFAKEYLERQHAKKIKDSLREILNLQEEIQLQVKVTPREVKTTSTAEKTGAKKPKVQIDEFYSIPLNPKYTFENFVIGPSNRLAQGAALRVAQAPAKSYNPLFIYGGVGLGKTHLLHAIGHYIMKNNQDSKIMYVTGETFAEHVVSSIREDKTSAFRRKYRSVDIWLVDDIQYIAAKERSEEEFFHTFNALYETNKQIVISSDRPPKELKLLEERLRSRFEAGLPVDIKPPELETRIAILEKNARNENIDLPKEVSLYIAERIHNNIRILEGALIKVIAYASLQNLPISLEVAKDALKDYSFIEGEREIDLERIKEVVCEYFRISLSDLEGKKRDKNIALPRQIAMYLARELTKRSLPSIGESFGGKDHSTVIHSCDKIKNLRGRDVKINSIIEEITKRLKM